ncbi:MAG: sigma-54-dependent Fis family transcriptional regulator [Spirochaetales bacterium]|nr:sigma-54-dependent Fis family transcriptional regulator [Spirochaetales bacterium]
MNQILIIDDEPGIRDVLKDVLEDESYSVITAPDGIEGLAILEKQRVDLVILDVWLPNMGGIEVLEKIKENYPDIEVIIISGHANVNLAVKAVKMGAYDFLEKPLSLEKTLTTVRNAIQYEELKKENQNLKNYLFVDDEIIGSGEAMKIIRSIIDQSAKSDSRILILGPNGTGKELIAKEIHRKSHRAAGPFIEVNCAAIPESLIESELFGHEKGAFTNAFNHRKGKFELAHKGTLFLDEVADMSMSTQAKVLRAIQELKFERVGSEESISVDVRIISATNKIIDEEIKANRFREDLFFRLNVIPIYVPPLKDRGDDLHELIAYFMEKYKRNSNQQVKVFSKEATALLKEYPWPGNIRELKNFIERINIMTDELEISKQACEKFLNNQQIAQDEPGGLNEFMDLKLNEAKDKLEREMIIEKLKNNNFNISRAAQDLGLYPSNLHSKIKKYGIEIDK